MVLAQYFHIIWHNHEIQEVFAHARVLAAEKLDVRSKMNSTEFVAADMSARSPRKSFSLILKNVIYRIKYPKNISFNFDNKGNMSAHPRALASPKSDILSHGYSCPKFA